MPLDPRELTRYEHESVEAVWGIMAVTINQLKKFVESDEEAEQALKEAQAVTRDEVIEGVQASIKTGMSDSELRDSIATSVDSLAVPWITPISTSTMNGRKMCVSPIRRPVKLNISLSGRAMRPSASRQYKLRYHTRLVTRRRPPCSRSPTRSGWGRRPRACDARPGRGSRRSARPSR